jgi:hypothetical protein
MIAQVRTSSGGGAEPSAEQTESMQKFVQEIAVKQRAVDGCEGIFIMAGAPGEDLLSVTLWRDEAAMKGAAGQQADDIAAARERNASLQVSEPKIYTVVASA